MVYLQGVLLFSLIWLVLFYVRKDLRWPMVWSGGLYVFVMSVGFVVIKLAWPDMPEYLTVVPGYWNPDTLFNLGRITGGYAIEDALYGFFTGGVAAAVYEVCFRSKIPKRHTKHAPHVAMSFAGIGGGIAAAVQVNLIWSLIIFGFVGAYAVILQRHDLWRHSVWGGVSYLVVYSAFFLVFMTLFPDFIPTTYSFHNFIGVHFLGIPLEEYLFALSFGMFWAPLYEYMHDIKSE